MANEIRRGYTTGSTLFGIVRDQTGQVWYPGGEAWEVYGTGSRTADDYAVSLTEYSSLYLGDFPTDIVAGTYYILVYVQAGASPADGDTCIDSQPQTIVWTGSAETIIETVSVTVTAICNYALAKIGGGKNVARITSIYDGSETANHCLVIWPQIRKEVICRAWWPEATQYADLGAELSGITQAGWKYAFNLPSDYLGRCQQINEIYHNSTKQEYLPRYDFEIIQRYLFTNVYSNEDGDSAYIRYIFNLQDTSKFSPLLYESCAVKFAAELAPVFLADDGSKRRYFLMQEYEDLVLPLAQGASAMEHGDDEDRGEYTAITARTE